MSSRGRPSLQPTRLRLIPIGSCCVDIVSSSANLQVSTAYSSLFCHSFLCMLQIQDLNLDNCRATQIEGLTDEFTNLTTLSLINVGLTTLKGFPNLPSLRKVLLLLVVIAIVCLMWKLTAQMSIVSTKKLTCSWLYTFHFVNMAFVKYNT